MHIYIYIWVYICCKKKHAVMSWIKFFMLSLWGILGLTSVRDGVKAVEVLYELHVEIHPGMWKAKEVLMLAIAKLCKWSHKSRLVEWITTKSCYSTKGCTPCAVHLQEWPCGQLDWMGHANWAFSILYLRELPDQQDPEVFVTGACQNPKPHSWIFEVGSEKTIQRSEANGAP